MVRDPRRERKPWHKVDVEGRGDRGTLPKVPWQDEGKKETAQEAGKERSGHKKEGSFSGVHCYNCGKRGHISRNCPSNVLCCVGWKESLRRAGLVNSHKVSDIMLDTGCSRTMVHGDLVSREQLIEGKATAVRCAHGDTVLYPMAEVEMEVDGCTIHTVAAVCNTLPMDVLLGTDVAELDSLLRTVEDQSRKGSLVLAVTTRSRARKEAEDETLRTKKQQVSGVKPNSLEQKEGDVWDMGTKLDDSIFHGGWEKAYVSRKQKREERQKYAARVRPDPSACTPHVLQKMSRKELKAFQEADPSLKAAREGAKHGKSVNGVSFVMNHEGILHRVVEPKEREVIDENSLCYH